MRKRSSLFLYCFLSRRVPRIGQNHFQLQGQYKFVSRTAQLVQVVYSKNFRATTWHCHGYQVASFSGFLLGTRLVRIARAAERTLFSVGGRLVRMFNATSGRSESNSADFLCWQQLRGVAGSVFREGKCPKKFRNKTKKNISYKM